MFTINSSGLKRIIKRIDTVEERIDKDIVPLQIAIGKKLVKRVRQGFAKSISPYGEPWAPVDRPGKPLIRSGDLRDSVDFSVGTEGLALFASAPHAGLHQLGANHIRRRVFIPDDRGLPADWASEVVDTISERVGRLL